MLSRSCRINRTPANILTMTLTRPPKSEWRFLLWHRFICIYSYIFILFFLYPIKKTMDFTENAIDFFTGCRSFFIIDLCKTSWISSVFIWTPLGEFTFYFVILMSYWNWLWFITSEEDFSPYFSNKKIRKFVQEKHWKNYRLNRTSCGALDLLNSRILIN